MKEQCPISCILKANGESMCCPIGESIKIVQNSIEEVKVLLLDEEYVDMATEEIQWLEEQLKSLMERCSSLRVQEENSDSVKEYPQSSGPRYRFPKTLTFEMTRRLAAYHQIDIEKGKGNGEPYFLRAGNARIPVPCHPGDFSRGVRNSIVSFLTHHSRVNATD